MKTMAAIAALLITNTVFASADTEQCLTNAYTQVEMNQCSSVTYEAADKELNRVYKQINESYKDDRKFIEKLTIAQRAWIAFRDAELEMKYPGEDKQSAYGSSYSMCANMYMSHLTIQRIETLKHWLKGVEEGDVCAGSMKLAE